MKDAGVKHRLQLKHWNIWLMPEITQRFTGESLSKTFPPPSTQFLSVHFWSFVSSQRLRFSIISLNKALKIITSWKELWMEPLTPGVRRPRGCACVSPTRWTESPLYSELKKVFTLHLPKTVSCIWPKISENYVFGHIFVFKNEIGLSARVQRRQKQQCLLLYIFGK